MRKYLTNNPWQFIFIFVLGFSSEASSQAPRKKILWGQSYEIVSSIGNTSSYEFEDNEKSISIRKYTHQKSETATSFIENKLAVFNSIYEPKRVDYPGQYSKFIECPVEFKPLYKEAYEKNGFAKYMISYANSNKAPGACSQDLIGYKHLYGFKYCRNEKAVYEIEIFSNTNSTYPNNFMGAISCN